MRVSSSHCAEQITNLITVPILTPLTKSMSCIIKSGSEAINSLHAQLLRLWHALANRQTVAMSFIRQSRVRRDIRFIGSWKEYSCSFPWKLSMAFRTIELQRLGGRATSHRLRWPINQISWRTCSDREFSGIPMDAPPRCGAHALHSTYETTLTVVDAMHETINALIGK